MAAVMPRSQRNPLAPVKVPLQDANNNVISPSKRQGSSIAQVDGKKSRRTSDENMTPTSDSSVIVPDSRRRPSTPLMMGKRRILVTSASKSRTPTPQKEETYSAVGAGLSSAPPDRLLCRDVESQRIRAFLDNHVNSGCGGSLYVSGAPGTGKTAVISSLMDEYQSRMKTVFVNCMTLKSSASVYSSILTALSGKPSNSRRPVQQILKLLSKPRTMVTVVLDEVDQIDSKHEEILYSMFEWPSLPNSKLILIGIANALDLTDRVLPRLQANPACQPELLHFPPYSRDQVITILKHRLGTSDVLDVSAVNFCAGKVAALSGDVRKALDICRRVVDRTSHKQTDDTPRKAGIADVMGVLNEGPSHDGMPLQQKLAVCAHLLLSRRQKLKEIPLAKLHQSYSSVCRGRQVQAVNLSEFISMSDMIEAAGIFSIKKVKESRMSKVRLNLNEEELRRTLQDESLLTSILTQSM